VYYKHTGSLKGVRGAIIEKRPPTAWVVVFAFCKQEKSK